jgi:hypothetical protein
MATASPLHRILYLALPLAATLPAISTTVASSTLCAVNAAAAVEFDRLEHPAKNDGWLILLVIWSTRSSLP